MKKKELEALFSEVSSKCCPVRGMYASPSTERERLIGRALKKFREKQLSCREKQALEKLLLPVLPAAHAAPFYRLLQKYYTPEQMPDCIFTALMLHAQNSIQH